MKDIKQAHQEDKQEFFSPGFTEVTLNPYSPLNLMYKKCITPNCTNHENEGEFVGDYCRPCREFISYGKGEYSQAYRNKQKEDQDKLIFELKICLEAQTFRQFKDLSESLYIERKLKENGYNVSKTALQLGIQRSHLYNKIERFNTTVRFKKIG